MSQQILENRQGGTQSTSTATNNETCVTCRMTSLRDSKLGNYTTHKFNQIYRELFVSFDGVDGGVCGSCYKKCYNERVKRGMLHRKDKGHLTTSNIVTGVRERRSTTTLANTTTAAATATTIANTEPQQQPKRPNKRNRHQYNNNEDCKNDPSATTQHRQQFSSTKKKRENSLQQQSPSSMNNNHSSSTQVNNNNHHELQHSHTNNDLITSDHFNSSTTTTTISSHHDHHHHHQHQHHYASTIATAVEPTVNVYFDFRLLLPDQDNKQHHHHHKDDDVENEEDSYEFDRTSKRIQIVKASIASALPVTALKREVKRELKELLLLIQHQQHQQYKQQTCNNSTNNKSKHDDQPYKLDDIKLFERDASGQIIEVDLMDDDEFFMQTPIEDKTRFVVYLRPNSTH